jgi:hypothetical protein
MGYDRVAGGSGRAPIVSFGVIRRATATKPRHEPAREPRCYTGAGRL